MPGDFGPVDVPDKYAAEVLAAARKWNMPPALLAAQLQAESSFNPKAVSPDGALGIAQFLPGTASELGINPLIPGEAIDGMAHLMSSYRKRFGTWDKALVAYHDGPNSGVDTPGRAGAAYVEKIMGRVGSFLSPVQSTQGDGGTAPVGSTVPAGLTNPLPNVGKFFDSLKDPALWKVIGQGVVGVGLIAAGAAVAFRGQVAGAVKGAS